MDTEVIDLINSIATIIISFVALIVSVIALVYTAKTYLLKSGAYIRGTFGTSSSIYCDDKYISNITIENLKDRAVVIFKIYLKLGHNYFIEIDNFETAPMILKPFEVFNKVYDPIDMYSIGMGRILLNDLLGNKSVKHQIVLSTSEGRYVVKEGLNYWDPITNFFQNYMTAIIIPLRSTYKGKSYGSNAKFVVELKWADKQEEVISIYPRDYEVRKFKKFKLTKESLESKRSLERYLNKKITEGKLSSDEVTVYDMESWRKEIYEYENKRIINASYQNWFVYNVIGRITTMFDNYKSKRKNKALQAQRKLKAPVSEQVKQDKLPSKPQRRSPRKKLR